MLWAVGLFLAILGLWLGIEIVRHGVAQRAARSAVASIPSSEREELFRLVEGLGTAPSRGSIGIFANGFRPDGKLTVMLPDGIDDFPWRGMVATFEVQRDRSGDGVTIVLSEAQRNKPNTAGETIRWVRIPAMFQANGKRITSIYSPDRYLSMSEELRRRASALHAKNPSLGVAYLLSVDGRHPVSEPFASLRCGLPPSWLQSPRFHKCDTCSQPMRLILQVPGFLLGSRQAEGCFYLFGCRSHPQVIAQDEDWG